VFDGSGSTTVAPGTPPAAVAPAAPPATAAGAETATGITRSVATPLAPERYRIQLTVSRETHNKFRHAQDLLRHALPSGDAAGVLDRALTLLINELERKRFAATSRPRPEGTPSTARHVPAAVRRAVWQRDAGRCRFVGASGRCRETAFLELHHVEPFATGGAATVGNIELRCRAHNLYEARLFFGESTVREEHASWVGPSWNSFRAGTSRASPSARCPTPRS
jgi:hypothetical protein